MKLGYLAARCVAQPVVHLSIVLSPLDLPVAELVGIATMPCLFIVLELVSRTWQDGSVGKGICCQTQGREFVPRDSMV